VDEKSFPKNDKEKDENARLGEEGTGEADKSPTINIEEGMSLARSLKTFGEKKSPNDCS